MFVCLHCAKEFTGSLTRQLAYLTGESGNDIAACKEVSDDQREGIKLEKRQIERSTQKGTKRTQDSQSSAAGVAQQLANTKGAEL